MSQDPLDQLSVRLFAAAREEEPSDGAEQRVLAQARRERAAPRPVRLRPRRLGWLLLAAALGSLALWRAKSKEPASAITAEPPTGASHPHAPQKAAEAPEPVSPPASARAQNPEKRPSAMPSAPRPVATLEDELGLLKQAESALSSGDAPSALKLLERYDAAGGKQMRAEATVLRIEALARAGKPDAASALAQSFVTNNPGSPLVDRARSYILGREKNNEAQ